MTHDELVDAAVDAINAVHGDTSVSQQETINSLRTLIGACETLIDAVETDMSLAADNDWAADDDG